MAGLDALIILESAATCVRGKVAPLFNDVGVGSWMWGIRSAEKPVRRRLVQLGWVSFGCPCRAHESEMRSRESDSESHRHVIRFASHHDGYLGIVSLIVHGIVHVGST